MSTRITAKLWTDEKFLSYSTDIHADVDDRAGRLIGLGLLFDAGHRPGRDDRVEVAIDRHRPRAPRAATEVKLGHFVHIASRPAALDEIVAKAGEIGVLALAAAAGVFAADVRRNEGWRENDDYLLGNALVRGWRKIGDARIEGGLSLYATGWNSP